MKSLNHDVVIIGAGAAGLAASEALSMHKTDQILVEARDRTGGRILTVRSNNGWPLELGAEFMHGRAPELQRIVDSGHLRACTVTGRHWFLRHDKLLGETDFFHDIDQVFNAMRGRAQSEDVSFAQFAESYLRTNPDAEEAIAAAKRYVEGFNAADARDVSIRWLIEEEDAADTIGGDDNMRFVDGYDGVIDWLTTLLAQRNVPILTNTLVKRIEWQPQHVVVHGSNRFTAEPITIHARAAIVTLPIGVLQATLGQLGAVEFQPPLASKLPALDLIAAGQVHRIVMTFSDPFWHHIKRPLKEGEVSLANAGFIHAPELPIPTWWTQNPLQTPILVGWAAGPPASKLADIRESHLRDLAVETLARLFSIDRKGISNRLLECLMHDWKNDPFARCAYSYTKVNGMPSAEQLAAPLASTLFFAGEATDTDGFSGTVHGALRTGIRAAHEVLHCRRATA